MEHAPKDPDVLRAYDDLIDQTTAQYKALEDAGYSFYFFDKIQTRMIQNLLTPCETCGKTNVWAYFQQRQGTGLMMISIY
jgi:hypothetical protein